MSLGAGGRKTKKCKDRTSRAAKRLKKQAKKKNITSINVSKQNCVTIGKNESRVNTKTKKI